MPASSPPASLSRRTLRFVEAARGFVRGAAREVDGWMSDKLGEEFNARLARVPLHVTEGGTDAFGMDPEWTKYALATVALLHRHYFRTQVVGAHNVPPGRVLLVANHSGQLPIDAALLGATMFMDVEPPRFIRAMVERWTQSLPFVSLVFTRIGQISGVADNARRLLEQDEALLVFPEGARGISKPFQERYRLVDFGLGFMRLALQTNTPIVPISVIGGEEQYISLGNLESIARALRIPSFPLVPQAFIGGLPLPTKYRITFGEPMRFTGDPDDDDAVIEEKVWLVKAHIQQMVNQSLGERKHWFW